jgi:hypothetical protein
VAWFGTPSGSSYSMTHRLLTNLEVDVSVTCTGGVLRYVKGVADVGKALLGEMLGQRSRYCDVSTIRLG